MCDEFIHPGLVTDSRLSRRSFGLMTVATAGLASAPALAQSNVAEKDVEVRSQLACSARRLPAKDGLAIVRNLLQHVVLFAGMVGGYGCIFLPHVPFTKMVEAEIGDDPVDPGVERTFETKAAEIFVRLQKGVLVNILGVGFRSGEVKSEP